MAKHSQEFKLKVVHHFLSSSDGHKKTAKLFNIRHSQVQRWVAIYERDGEKSLISNLSRIVYEPDFKLKVVKSMVNDGLSLTEVTEKYCLKSPSTAHNWLKVYNKYGVDGLITKPKERLKQMPKIQRSQVKTSQEDRDKTQEQLLDEIAYLRAENAYLKKRRALIQKQKEQEKAEQQRLQDSYLN